MKHKRVRTQPFVVCGGLIEKNNKILLVREASKKIDTNKWNLPTGWVDLGEELIDTAKREVKEETGYDFTPCYILGIYSLLRTELKKYFGSVPHPIKIIYVGKISGKQSKLADDISEIKWFSPKEIFRMDKDTLRDLDIKQIVKDYFSGKKYPLNLITHTHQH